VFRDIPNEEHMTEPTASPSPQDLALLDQVIRTATRARRIAPEDAEDFAQHVHVRLIERNYSIFAQFAGRSSLRTYLTVVVRRMWLDWQNHLYGKWQPTVAAIRLGPFAVDLERLICRDAFTVDEAVECVRSVTGAPSVERLRRTAAVVAQRSRRRFVPDDDLSQTYAVDFVDLLLVREAKASRARAHRLLAAELQRLSADDRALIVQRYRHRTSVQSLAQRLAVDPKALYRRFDRVLRSLRKGLVEHGLTAPPAMHPQ
jgi:RNA polymerase sigma factor (sigma-70 family)